MWTPAERERFQKAFIAFGYPRAAEVKAIAHLEKRSVWEVLQYSKVGHLQMNESVYRCVCVCVCVCV